MKKIFTLFSACICAMSMFALTYNVTVPAGTKACYIAGEMNGWSQVEMTKVDDTHYTIDVADATDAMKYKYCSGPSWAYVEKTADGNEVADRTYAAEDVVEAWAAVYDPTNVPEPGEAKDITVKAKVPAEWTDQITAWVWPTGGAGTEVVPTQEGEWYVVTHNCAELNIIFKNGAGWNGDANQTVDMTFTENTCIEITAGAGKANYTAVDCEGDNPGTDPLPEPKDITVKATVPAEWTDQITAWVWHASEPGKEVIPTQEGEWYAVTEHCAELNIIFKNGAGWNGDANQTVDMTFTENTCIEITAGAGKANYTAVDCEGDNPGTDPLPEPKDITVKATVPAEWTDQITAWVWHASEPGKEVIPTQEGEWYAVTEHCAELNIIFKNGAGWNGDANQTVDIAGITENTCVAIATDGATKATYTVVDCPESTDVENIVTTKHATKTIYNGQIVVLRDGMMFNLLGQEVK